MLNQLAPYLTSAFQRFRFLTSAPHQDDKETNKHTDDGVNKSVGVSTEASSEANNVPGTEKAQEAGSLDSVSKSSRKRTTKRTAFSDSDSEDLDLSKVDLVKLLLEKDESLKSKDEEFKDMKDKVHSRKHLFLNSSLDSGAGYHRSIQFNQVLSYYSSSFSMCSSSNNKKIL